ncbi:MAG TPA: hypothetical protein VKV26_13205 [Dehalococcoidia bacterium]|nr:hypothetical protein [Dehalococcoidia bacterium]
MGGKRHALFLVFVSALAITAGCGGAAKADRTAAGSRISWQGGNWFLSGANVPWYNWACDFGCGASKGVSDPAVAAPLAAAFKQAHDAGLHTLRWWMFEGDAWQISRDQNGAPSGLNPQVYTDLDAALQLASDNDLYLDLVLFSAPTHPPRAWITDEGQRQALVAALTPLFAHYNGNPRLFSWEVFNEPEWDIWTNKIDQASVTATVKAIADAVHASSSAYVTVGSAMLDGLPMWIGQGLDYYQAHWYDYMKPGNWCALCATYDDVRQRYSLDAPLVIGEFYAGSDIDAAARLNTFYNAGYAGAWPWSLFPDHTSDHQAIDLAGARKFADQHSDLGPLSAPPAGP